MNDPIFVQFCDDIRQEGNGKWILVGCYGDTMLIEKFPLVSNLQGFVTFRTDNTADFFNIRLSLASGAELVSIKMRIAESPYRKGEVSVAQMPTPSFDINLSREDEIILYFWAGGDEPREAGRLKVELVEEI